MQYCCKDKHSKVEFYAKKQHILSKATKKIKKISFHILFSLKSYTNMEKITYLCEIIKKSKRFVPLSTGYDEEDIL